MISSTILYIALLAVLAGAVSLVRPLRVLRVHGRRDAVALAAGGAALAAAVALFPSRLERRPASTGATASSRLEERMPAFHFNEHHEMLVQASRERTYSAIKAVRPGEIRLFLLLTGIRSLNPARLFGRGVPRLESQSPMLDVTQGGGFFLLDDDLGREIVLGTCGRFWQLRGSGRCPGVRAAEEVLAFREPGYAKAVINFHIAQEGNGCRVTTETRILATDDGARRRFAAYWRLIHPGSALLRRGWLEAIKRRAEARPS